jgi:Fe-S-cluster-containing dehydrogenase component/DMSO reductase anchor subunit
MVAPRQPWGDLLAELLAEQGRLQTPVARFSAAPRPEPAYRDLIPLTKPGPGEQYAFEVDLDSCSGCKACVVACHSLNGLEENESWRDVGLIHGGTHAVPFQQTVTTACHHCADPGCLNGCPVLAYEKDPVTGIVRHLDDQCIGCQYCVLKCPYDVPKYSERLGIVRKCDMCHNRLAAGEAPACVQACPTESIRIVKVELQVDPAPRVDTSKFLPVAPDPAYTQPTTRYVSRQPLPENATAADAAALRPQPPHWPLVLMLTLLPMAVGCHALAATLVLASPGISVTYYITHFGWGAGMLGLGASVFHLGQPLRAWRIFLGWRRSWLSREALLFGAWLGAATVATVTANGWSPVPLPLAPLLAATTLIGLAGLFCSVMIYVDTRRVFWRLATTAPRFFGSAAVLGLAGVLTGPDAPQFLGFMLAGLTLGKICLEARALDPTTGGKTAQLLLSQPLRSVNELRVAAAVLGGLLPPLLRADGAGPAVAWLALALLLAGELAERYLFFRAVDAPKMPGNVPA